MRAVVVLSVLLLSLVQVAAMGPLPAEPLQAATWDDLRAAHEAAATLRDGRSPDVPVPPVPGTLEEWATMLATTPEHAQAIVDALPEELAYPIAVVRSLQSSGHEAMTIAQVAAALLPPPPRIHELQKDLPADDSLCPIDVGGVRRLDSPMDTGFGLHPDGRYGGMAGLCITGTDSKVYSSTREYSFGSYRGTFVDLGGDDEYSAGFGSFGAYSGVFLELAGDDQVYADGIWSVGASGGLHYDHAGDDLRDIVGQGGGYGGLLVDMQGHDRYKSWISGWGHFGGSLYDISGDDHYSTDIQSGMGTNGVFVDLEGDDLYQSNTGGSIGSMGGVFLDGRGDDVYEVPSGLGYRAGIFVDLRGRDQYRVPGPGLGVDGGTFLDAQGDDHYDVGPDGFGAFGGFFYDLAGDDAYPANADPGMGCSDFATGLCGAGSFYDGEDPEGRGDANGQAVLGGMPMEHGVTLPVDALYAQLDGAMAQAWSAEIALLPEVAKPGTSLAFDGAIKASTPVHAVVRDDQGTRLSIDPPGSLDDLPGYYMGTSDIQVAYVVPSTGPRTLTIELVESATGFPLATAVTGQLTVDDTPPTITTTFSDGNGRQTLNEFHSESGSAGLTVSAQDLASGIQALYVKKGSAPVPGQDVPVFEQVPGADGRAAMSIQQHVVPLSSLADGEHDIHILAIDGVGWHATAGPITILVDRTAPDLRLRPSQAVGPGGYFTVDPGLVLTASDAGAGIDTVRIRTSGATTAVWDITSFDASGQADVAPAQGWPDGQTEIRFEGSDLAHTANEATGAPMTIQIDTVPPQVGLIDAGGTPSLPWTLTAVASDQTSGIESIETRAYEEGQPPSAWVASANMTLDTPGDWIVQARAVDVAGHESVVERRIPLTSPPPIAAFEVVSIGTTLDDVVFTDLSTDDVGVDTWHWDFGDGSTSTDQHPTHRYAGPGTYTVTLTASDAHGGSSSTTRVVDVANVPPTASFSLVPTIPVKGQPVQFASTSTDPDSDLTAWRWDMDGVPLTGSSVEHTFLQAGDHTVRLTVEDGHGDTGTVTRIVQVRDLRPPVPSFTQSHLAATRLDEVTFTDTSLETDTKIVQWSWDLAGSTRSGHSVSHSFFEIGTHPVTLTITDDQDNVQSIRGTIRIDPMAPTVKIHDPGTVQTGEPLSLVADAVDPDGSITRVTWTIGTETLHGTATSISFERPGAYPILVEVEDDDGQTASSTAVVTVHNRGPDIRFEAPMTTDRAGPTDLGVHVDDPDGSVAQVAWVVEGVPYTGDQVRHTFQGLGSQEIQVTATDDLGGVSTATWTITVLPVAPQVSIQGPDTIAAATIGTWVAHAQDPDGVIVDHHWNTGPHAETLHHAFDRAGTYTLSLLVTDDDGMTATATKTITVTNQPPRVAWSALPGATAGQAVTFRATGEDPEGTAMQFVWSLDGTDVGTGPVLEHTFPAPGTYQIGIRGTDADGGADEHTAAYQVGNRPPTLSVPGWTAQNGTAHLVAHATDPDGGPVTYTWSIAGQTYTGDRLELALAPGTHEIHVAATDADGATVRFVGTLEVAAPALVVEPTQNTTEGPVDEAVADKQSPGLPVIWLVAVLFAARRGTKR